MGHGVTKEGRYYQRWRADIFKHRFYLDGKLRCDADIRAIIFSSGGPFPSELESYTFEVGSDGYIYWFLNLYAKVGERSIQERQ